MSHRPKLYRTPHPPPPLPPEPRNIWADERAAWMLAAQADVAVRTHIEKKTIDDASAQKILELKADVQIRKQLLADRILVEEDGEFVRNQEFLREKPKKYSFCNFKIMARPIIYRTQCSQRKVLSLSVLLQSQKTANIFLDLERTDVGYFSRKFRDAGLQIKKKRGERAELIFQVIEVICEMSESLILPYKNGFYKNEAGNFSYASVDDLTWEEVLLYAR